MKVAKFGGSSLASPEQVEKVCGIVESDSDRKIIVVSAPGKRFSGDTKVTDLLIEAADAHLAGGEGREAILEVTRRFAAIGKAFGVDSAILQTIEDDLLGRLAASMAHPGRYKDSLKAAGEDNNAKLVAAILTMRGLPAHYVDPKEAGLLLTDEAGDARVLPASFDNLHRLRERDGILVFPGFFGYSEAGHLVTFPRGGSDISGAVMAAAVKADVYENFTDVDSVLVADPGLIENPVAINELTYREMRELSYSGFSVFHDEALEPVYDAEIPVHIRNTNNPTTRGTRVVARREITSERPVVGIAAQKGFCSLYIEKYLMNREVGFGRKVLQVLEEEGLSFEHAPTGIDNMSIILRRSAFPRKIEDRVVMAIEGELGAQVNVDRALALVMVVGEGMRHHVGLAAKAAEGFAKAGVNIEMINQGSSEVSMMFGVQERDMAVAVEALYQQFFGNGSD